MTVNWSEFKQIGTFLGESSQFIHRWMMNESEFGQIGTFLGESSPHSFSSSLQMLDCHRNIIYFIFCIKSWWLWWLWRWCWKWKWMTLVVYHELIVRAILASPTLWWNSFDFAPISKHDMSQHFVMHYNAMRYIWLMYLAWFSIFQDFPYLWVENVWYCHAVVPRWSN